MLSQGIAVAVIACPEPACVTEFEGTWLWPDEPGEPPEDTRQLCPGCGHTWEAEYPGYSFVAEAG